MKWHMKTYAFDAFNSFWHSMGSPYLPSASEQSIDVRNTKSG